MSSSLALVKKGRLLAVVLGLCSFALPLVSAGQFTWLLLLLIIVWLITEKPYLQGALLLDRLRSPFFLIPFLFLLIQFVAVFWGQDRAAGLRYVERQLPLFLLPLIFLTTHSLNGRHIMRSFTLYVAGVALAVLVSYAYALAANYALNGLTSLDPSLYSYHQLARPIVHHAVYFAAMLAMAVILIVYLLSNGFWQKNRLWSIPLLLVLLISLLLLQGRIVVLALLLLPLCLSVLYLMRTGVADYKKIIRLAVPALLLLLMGAGVLYYSEGQRARYGQLLNLDANNLIGSTKENGVSQRVYFWMSGWEAIKERPVMGYGTGDGFLALKYQFEKQLAIPETPASVKRALGSFLALKTNVHNQYLHVWITTGIAGVLLFLLLLAYPAWYFWKVKLYGGLAFLFVYGCFCLTETVFNWHFGVLPFAMFYAQFIYLARLQFSQNHAVNTKKQSACSV